MAELHVYKNEDGDYVIAESNEDAFKVFLEHVGGTAEDYDEQKYTQLPDDKMISVYYDDKGDIPSSVVSHATQEDGKRFEVEVTAAEWVACYGRSLLCSYDC